MAACGWQRSVGFPAWGLRRPPCTSAQARQLRLCRESGFACLASVLRPSPWGLQPWAQLALQLWSCIGPLLMSWHRDRVHLCAFILLDTPKSPKLQEGEKCWMLAWPGEDLGKRSACHGGLCPNTCAVPGCFGGCRDMIRCRLAPAHAPGRGEGGAAPWERQIRGLSRSPPAGPGRLRGGMAPLAYGSGIHNLQPKKEIFVAIFTNK